MSAYITDIRYSVDERDRFRQPVGMVRGPFGVSPIRYADFGPPTVTIEMRIKTDDLDFVELLQRVCARGGDFADVVVALARQAMVSGPESVSRAAQAVDEANLRATYEMLGAAIAVEPSEIERIARDMGVMPSPSLARDPTAPIGTRQNPKPLVDPKPTRMGVLEFDDDADKEKKP